MRNEKQQKRLQELKQISEEEKRVKQEQLMRELKK